MNALLPAYAAEAFKESRIVAFSSICVYPFASVTGGGSVEDDPIGASGEYPISVVARERVLEYFSRRYGTPGRLLRLCYAIDMRYGVLHEIATKVREGTPIDLATGNVSIIWQGDASAQTLRTLRHCTAPTSPLNIVTPEVVSVRALATAFGRHFDCEPVFAGSEADTAWLVNGTEAARLFGNPAVSTARMIDWTADWVARDMPAYGKPTHYDVRDGRF
jgi:nucleoside-diphosphate-sugar epimerase